LAAERREFVLGTEIEARERCEAGPDEEADGRGVLPLEQDARGGEGVQRQKATARQKGQRDEEHACVSPPARSLAEDEPDDRVHDRDEEDEPEVRSVVLPVDVQRRPGEEQEEPGQRKEQGECPAGHARG
jgi:hypothetical protein